MIEEKREAALGVGQNSGEGRATYLQQKSESVHNGTDVRLLRVYCGVCKLFSQIQEGIGEIRESGSAEALSLGKQGDSNMLGILAAVLIVLWLLGFFAFHVTTGFIHILLVVGIVLLVFHLLRGRTATA